MALSFTEILKVIFLGIVEGVTEWLPISSTGHMLLVDEFLTLNMSDAFKDMFFVVISSRIKQSLRSKWTPSPSGSR